MTEVDAARILEELDALDRDLDAIRAALRDLRSRPWRSYIASGVD